jgi:hypothetical protein
LKTPDASPIRWRGAWLIATAVMASNAIGSIVRLGRAVLDDA